MATVSQLKRIGRWVVSEECYPDPNRYPFTEMTAVSADGNLVKFRRMLMGCVLVTAGVVVMVGKRDDGAGAKDLKAPHRPQWANANVARDLLAQLEEKRDETSDAEYGHVCTALATALFKATSLGGETLSLAMARAMSIVPQLVQDAKAFGAEEEKGEEEEEGEEGEEEAEEETEEGGEETEEEEEEEEGEGEERKQRRRRKRMREE